MKLKSKKAFAPLVYVLSVFGIAIMLLLFYMWMSDNVTKLDAKQAKITSNAPKYYEFYSTLINEKGATIADSDKDETEKILEEFVKGKITGETQVQCKEEEQMKCELTVIRESGEEFYWQVEISSMLPQTPIKLRKFTLEIHNVDAIL